MPSSGHNEHNTPGPPTPTTNTCEGFQFVPVNFAKRNLHRLQRRCIIIKCSCWFIVLIRCFVPRPPSNRVQKYDLRFPLLLSTDDHFPRNYFKPCWPHTVYQRQNMFMAFGCCWKIESLLVQASEFVHHGSDNPFLSTSRRNICYFDEKLIEWGKYIYI